MSRVAYVNGQYVPHAEAQIHIEDRGYQFADGVYEVAAIFRGRIIDEDGHLVRLKRSLDELQMPMPMPYMGGAIIMGGIGQDGAGLSSVMLYRPSPD